MSTGDHLQKCPICSGFLFYPEDEPPVLWCDCKIKKPYPREHLDPSEIPNYYRNDESTTDPGE